MGRSVLLIDCAWNYFREEIIRKSRKDEGKLITTGYARVSKSLQLKVEVHG